MFRIYLIRHGETIWNTESRLQGHSDSRLTGRGQAQAREIGAKLHNVLRGQNFRVISSPLGRCMETAAIIVSELGLNSEVIEREDRVKELCYGNWEGMTKNEVKLGYPQLVKARESDRWNVAPPNGESYSDVAARLRSWLEDLHDENLIVVSHGCSGRILRGMHDNSSPDEIAKLDESHSSIFLLEEGAKVTELC